MTQTRNYDFAKKAYDAYSAQSGGKSLISGAPLPTFDVLTAEIQDAWYAAADAVSVAAVDALHKDIAA